MRAALPRRERPGVLRHQGDQPDRLRQPASSPARRGSSSSTGRPTRSNSRSGCRPKRRRRARTSSAPKSGPPHSGPTARSCMQQQTLLGPNTKFKAVPLLSGADDIAFVAIERGQQGHRRPTRTTGVMLAPLRRDRATSSSTTSPTTRPPRHRKAASCSAPRRRPPASRPGHEIAADQNPGHLDREPEPLGEPGLAGTHRAARRHRHLHAEPDQHRRSRSSSSKPKNGRTGPVHGDGRRLRRQRRNLREALERPDPDRNHRTVQLNRSATTWSPAAPRTRSAIRIATDPQLSDPIEVDAYLNPAQHGQVRRDLGRLGDRSPPRQRDDSTRAATKRRCR